MDGSQGPGKAELSLGHILSRGGGALVAAVLASGVALLTSVVESVYAAAGIGGLVLLLLVGIMMSGLPKLGSPRGRFHEKDYDAWRNADLESRGDAEVYRRYRALRTELDRAWRGGEFEDAAKRHEAKDNALNAVLDTETRRIAHCCRRPVTLTIVEDTGSDFVARRSSATEIGAQIPRGMTCPHNTALDTVIDRYAAFHYAAEFQVCGQRYFLAALSDDEPFDAAAVSLIEDAATQYQATYHVVRLLSVSTPPAAPPPASTNA